MEVRRNAKENSDRAADNSRVSHRNAGGQSESGVWAQAKPSIPPHGKLLALFNGKNFTGFDTLLEKQGINRDPNKVFQVEKGVLHISGQEFGGLVTQKEYENYYLRAEFKWGEKTYPPRDGKARDSGIQYNITGPLKVWPRMMEFQINEGGTGDMWVVGGTGATVDGKVYESTSSGPGAYIRIPHIGRGAPGQCHRTPRSGKRSGASARKMECSGTCSGSRSHFVFCERKTLHRRNKCQHHKGQNPFSV